MKKILSVLMSAMVLLSGIAMTVSAVSFVDVDKENAALSDAVELLYSIGVTKGVSETEFGTEQNVTREQMAAFIYRMMNDGASSEGGENTTSFTDLEDPTFFPMISWAAENGIIKGRSESIFDPKGGITLQDAYTMIVRALGYDDGSVVYPYGYISYAEDNGLSENLTIHAEGGYTQTLTRGETAIVLANMYKAMTENKENAENENLDKDVIDGENTDENTDENAENAENTEDKTEADESIQQATEKDSYTLGELSPDDEQLFLDNIGNFRYMFEQSYLPGTFLLSTDEDFVTAINNRDESLITRTKDYWNNIMKGQLMQIQMASEAQYAIDGEADLDAGYTALLEKYGVEASDVMTVSFEQTPDGNNVLLVAFKDVIKDDLTLVTCKYIGIASDGDTVRYFTAEYSAFTDMMKEGDEDIFMLCEINVESRGSYGVIYGNPEAFLGAVGDVISK